LNNISILEKIINENNLSLKELNNEGFDILIYIIEHEASYEIIEYILNKNEYQSLNYHITENNQIKSPLFLVIGRNDFKIANLLIKYSANINYLNYNIINFLNNRNLLNNKNLKYILYHGIDIKAITLNLIHNLIENSKNEFLETIFNFYKFDNSYILNLLNLNKKYYVNKNLFKNERHLLASLNKEFQNNLNKEKQKININESMYKKAIENENYLALKILFENESSEEDEILNRIIKYDIMELAIKLNNYKFIKNILKYDAFNYKCINYEKIFSKVIKNDNIEIAVLLIKVLLNSSKINGNKIDETSYSEKHIQHCLSLILNIAIKMHSLILIKYIIEKNEFKLKININDKDINGECPIITAFYANNFEIFKYLLEHGGDCNSKNNNGISLLILAIDKNEVDIVKYLLSKPEININEKDTNDNTPLIKAINQNNLKIVKLIINYCTKNKIKININENDSYGNSPLIKAINQNNFDIIFLLVNYALINNIDINVTNTNENIPLILSYKQGYLKIFKYLLKYFDINQCDSCGNSILYYAIDNEDVEMVINLISMGANINQKNKIGNSILDYAIFKGNVDILNILIEKDNILLNETNSKGETPLITIIREIDYTLEDKEKIVYDFIKKGSKVNIFDENNNSPLIYAIQKRYTSIAKLLMKNGAHVNITNKEGYSPLDYAIKTKNYDIANYLYDCGSDVYNIKTITFEALKQIITDNNLSLFKKLMANNIDINMKSSENGNTLLHYSISYGNINMVKYLLKYGADKEIKNNDGQNAYNINMNFNKFNQTYNKINDMLNS